MAETSASIELCTICQEDDVSNNASVWCFECDDFLCVDCSRVHSRSKSLKGHKVTTIEDYRKLPKFVLDIKNRCSEHDEKCEFYCSFHGNACCVKCLQDLHKECRELRPLREVLENFKSSSAVSTLEQDLQKIEENLNKITKCLESRRDKNQEQGSAILKEINRIRGEVNANLDKIEQKIIDELTSEQKGIDTKLEKIVSQVEDRKQAMISIREDFSKIKRHATELQSYIGFKQIESIASEEINFIANLVNNDLDTETNIVMEVSLALETLVHDIASFGKIVVCSSKSADINEIGVLREQNAQLSVKTSRTIHDIELNIASTIEISAEHIYGCAILSKGKMAFADYDNKTLLLYQGGNSIGEISLSSYPGCCALVKDNLVAVTLPELEMIQFVDVEKHQIVKEIEVEGECWDIHVEDEKLFVRLNAINAVNVLDLERDANVIQRVIISGYHLLNISIFRGLIYCTNWDEDTVYCYTMEGKILWTFKHDDLRQPSGISIDSVGFIYVSCSESNKLMVISPDGKNGKVLLDEKDGLLSPEALCIDKSLILITSRNKTLLYHI